MQKFKNIFSGENPDEQSEETGIVDELWKNSTLSWSTRIKGFAIMFIVGWIISFMATFFFWFGLGGLILFAVLYTVGNICSLCSTLFLMGPISQLKKMFASTRVVATLIMLASFIMTLISAILLNNGALCLIFVIIQFFALLWYSLSYIPFARDAVKKIFSSVIDV